MKIDIDNTKLIEGFSLNKNMKVTITYKPISEDLQKIKAEKICKIVANAIIRNKSENNKYHIEMSNKYFGKKKSIN